MTFFIDFNHQGQVHHLLKVFWRTICPLRAERRRREARRERCTYENCNLPTIHLGPAGRRPALGLVSLKRIKCALKSSTLGPTQAWKVLTPWYDIFSFTLGAVISIFGAAAIPERKRQYFSAKHFTLLIIVLNLTKMKKKVFGAKHNVSVLPLVGTN